MRAYNRNVMIGSTQNGAATSLFPLRENMNRDGERQERERKREKEREKKTASLVSARCNMHLSCSGEQGRANQSSGNDTGCALSGSDIFLSASRNRGVVFLGYGGGGRGGVMERR